MFVFKELGLFISVHLKYIYIDDIYTLKMQN